MMAVYTPAGARRSCPLCGGRCTPAFTASDRNRAATSERFAYDRCEACGTLAMADVPDELSPFYAGAYHGFRTDGSPEWTANPALREAEAFRVQLLRRHLQPGTLIDIGAGAGAFAAAARDGGFEVKAIEMDERCCRYIEDDLHIDAICSDDPVRALASLAPARVITLWHVLEHLRDPAAMLAAAAERLERDGMLVVGLPNPRALQFRLLGTRWAHLDAPRHLCLMPAEAVVAQAQKHGLRAVAMITDEPFGRICDVHGWVCALRRDPAAGDPSPAVIHLAQAIASALRPIERGGVRGTTFTLLLRR